MSRQSVEFDSNEGPRANQPGGELRSARAELMNSHETLEPAIEGPQLSVEELQCAIAELKEVNTRLHLKIGELTSANEDLWLLFAASEIATVFFDCTLRVVKFTPAAIALFPLIDTGVRRSLVDLAPRFVGEDLVSDAQEALRDIAPIERQVQSNEGTWFMMRVLPYRAVDGGIAGILATFFDISSIKRAEQADNSERKAVERRLAYLASFPEHNPNPIVEADCEGRVCYANPAAQRLFPDLMDRGPAHPWLASWRDAGKSHTCVRDIVVGERSYHQSLHTVVEAGVVRAYGLDVTERVRVQEKLRASEERFAKAFQLGPMPMGIADAETHRLVEVNDAWVDTYGFSRDEALGRTARELGMTDSDEERMRILDQAQLRGKWPKPEMRVRTKNGSVLVIMVSTAAIELNGRPCKMSITMDVTSSRQAADAVRESEATLRGILNAATESIWLFNIDGVTLAGNQTAFKRWGKPPETVLGKRLHEFLPPELARSRFERLREAARSGRPVEFEDMRDGIQFEHTFYPVLGNDGRVDRVAVFSRDVTERRLAVQALQRYELLASRSRDIVLFIRRDDGRILEANAAALNAYGYTREEILALAIHDLRSDDVKPLTEQQIEMADAHGILFENTHRRKDGTCFPVEVGSRGATVNGTTILVSVVRDITERKRTEAALRESEERFRIMADSSPISMWVTDNEGEVRFVNRRYRQFFGASLEQVVGNNWQPLIHPDDAPDYVETFLGAVRGHRPFAIQLRVRRADGEWRWVDSHGEPRFASSGEFLGHVGVVVDITELKQAEDALREAKQRLESLLENSPLAVIEWSCPEYRIVRWSDEATAVFGWSAEEVVGKRIDEIPWVYEEDSHLVQQVMADMLIGTCSRNVSKNRNRRKNGTVIHCEWYNSTVVNSAGGVAAVLSLVLDVTELRRAESALLGVNLQLAETDRRKNEFLALLSHELRNPLTPIRNSLHVLNRAAPGSDQAKRAQDVIGRQAGQLMRLVDDLLDFTRVAHHKIRLRRDRIDLNDLVRQTIEDHRFLFEEKEIIVETTLATEQLAVDGDIARLAQVIGNMLLNAAKFTSINGRVTIDTQISGSGERAKLRVIDNGAGIEPEILSRLFEPFMQADTTLDRTQGGLGLGLALVKGMVEMHGGSVCAHSEGRGQGATFTVELPLVAGAIAGRSSAPTATVPVGRRVLIIEDNIDAADSLREALEFGEHVVDVAYDGPEGLAKARELRPEVVLCDIGLPGMDGFEVARTFRADESLQGIVLVALSGYALAEDLRRAADAGFHQHLAKPPSLEQLDDLLRRLPDIADGSLCS